MDPKVNEIVRLSTELQAMCGSLARGSTALQDCEGSDPHQAVTVVLDQSGRVAAVRPSALWAQRIQPEALGGAVLQAVQAAQAVRMERWVAAARVQPPMPAPPVPEPSASTGPAFDPMALLDEVITAFEAIDGFSEQVAARSAQRDASTDEEIHDGARVSLSSLGEPVSVHVDPAWARRANLSRLSERLLEAFEQAYAQYDSGAATQPAAIEFSPQMKAVAADPGGALLRYVEGLRSSLT